MIFEKSSEIVCFLSDSFIHFGESPFFSVAFFGKAAIDGNDKRRIRFRISAYPTINTTGTRTPGKSYGQSYREGVSLRAVLLRRSAQSGSASHPPICYINAVADCLGVYFQGMLAERVGFEPTARCRVTGFQDQLLKPLGHLSINILPVLPKKVKQANGGVRGI